MEVFLFFSLYFWVALSIAIGKVGAAKGRGGFDYFIGSLLFSPLVMGVVALGVPSLPKPESSQTELRRSSRREPLGVFVVFAALIGFAFLAALLQAPGLFLLSTD